MKFKNNIYLCKRDSVIIIFLTVLNITKVVFVMFETNWKC